MPTWAERLKGRTMNPVEQQFFNDLEKKLWTAADKLRSSLDASVYKHVVLGLIFLKYVSDAFEERQNELRTQFQNPEHDYYMAPADYPDDYESALAAELEVRDYYIEKNVFWVPIEARWQTLRDLAQLPPGAELPWLVPKRDGDGRYVRDATGELEMVHHGMCQSLSMRKCKIVVV
jgi:type I restriction enzyme M protein